MKMNVSEEANRWLSQALRDLDDARFSMDGQRYNLACFLAQQSAEKALNGCFFFRGAESVWGHSVAELCNNCGDFDRDFSELNKSAASLDKYYIPTRYPNGLPGGIPADAFLREDAELSIKISQQVIDTVKAKISR
jgi:HEPN domain-containing protein